MMNNRVEQQGPGSKDLRATLHFLANDPLYKTVKPYTLHRSYTSSIPYDNFIDETVDNVAIQDLRGIESSFSFEENGFGVLEMPSAMSYDDFNDREKIEDIYCKEVGDALIKYMGASSVQIFDFAVSCPGLGFRKSVGLSSRFGRSGGGIHLSPM